MLHQGRIQQPPLHSARFAASVIALHGGLLDSNPDSIFCAAHKQIWGRTYG